MEQPLKLVSGPFCSSNSKMQEFHRNITLGILTPCIMSVGWNEEEESKTKHVAMTSMSCSSLIKLVVSDQYNEKYNSKSASAA